MRTIALLYARELRGALRESSLVTYSLLIPLLMYPLMMWLAVTGLTFVSGQTEGQGSRVAALEFPAEHAELRAALEQLESLERLELTAEAQAKDAALNAALERLAAGELDLVVRFEAPAEPAPTQAPDFAVFVFFDGSSDRSNEAKARFEQSLSDYRETWLAAEAEAAGVSPEVWARFEIVQDNRASESEMGAFILGLLAPITILAMMGLGAMYPAIDAIAGERERATWETSLTLGVSRTQLLVAKYLYVATMAGAAGMLNMVGISVSLAGLMNQIGGGTIDVSVPLSAWPLLLLGIALLALLFAAMMLGVASFARTFREGQAVVTPMYLVVVLPALFATQPLEDLTLAHAAMPVINVMVLFKQAILASVRWDFVAVTLVSSAACVVLCLGFARVLLGREELVLGSFQGSAKQVLRGLLRRQDRKDERT